MPLKHDFVDCTGQTACKETLEVARFSERSNDDKKPENSNKKRQYNYSNEIDKIVRVLS